MSRRCMTVTSLGEVGMTLPSRSRSSRNNKLACTGASSVCAAPVPVTRSMASFGRTHRRSPANESVITTTTKTKQGTRMLLMSDLDGHNFANNSVAEQLQPDGAAGHNVAHIVLEKEADVVRIGVEHENRHPERNTAQGQSGHPSVRADGTDLASQLEALTNDIGELVQDFRKVPAGTLLQQHRRDEELHIQHGNALGQFLQRHFQR